MGRIRRITLAADGTLWLSCGEQICSLNNDTLRVFGPQEGVAADDWNSFLEDSQGRMWVRSPQHLLMHEPASATFMPRDPPAPELAESRDTLAMMLGITRQTLSLELKAMAEKGAIALRYGRIEIVSKDILSSFQDYP